MHNGGGACSCARYKLENECRSTNLKLQTAMNKIREACYFCAGKRYKHELHSYYELATADCHEQQ